MWNIQIDNHVKRENKLEEHLKKAYVMIFKELCPHNIQNSIKEHPKHGSFLNNFLKLIDTIYQSMHGPIQATLPYLPLT